MAQLTQIEVNGVTYDIADLISGFVTTSVNNLANYYLKSDTYTRAEVQQLIAAIQGVSFVSVATLPTASADTMGGKIYLVPSSNPKTQNVKDEYITIEANGSYSWEKIGSTEMSLDGYVTDAELNAALSDYTTTADLTALLSGKVDKETGKGLSENDYTDEDKALVGTINGKQDTIQDLEDIRSGAALGATAYQKPPTGIPATDLAGGVIPDVSQFITRSVNDLANYYLKSETYTKTEVQNLIGAIQQFHYEIAASTSAVVGPASNVLYLIGPTGTGADKYEEYVYDSTKQDPWVKIGDTSIDLSGYVTTTALNTALADYTTTANLTTLLAGKQDKIDSTHKLDYSFLDNTPSIPDAVEANPTVPAGTTPTDLQNLKVGNDYYAVPGGGDDEAKEVAAAGLCDLDKRIKDILTQVLTRSDVRDNLTSAAIAKPLSANQGVVLKKINDDNEEVLAAALCSLYALSAIPAAIAPPYSGSKTYALNDCVTHKTLFWRCTTQVSSPEVFDPNKWTQSSLYEEMLRLLNA